jgi:hypothetical protein
MTCSLEMNKKEDLYQMTDMKRVGTGIETHITGSSAFTE